MNPEEFLTADFADEEDFEESMAPRSKLLSSINILFTHGTSNQADGMLHEEITRDIIGAAMCVLNELKPGLDEKLYENALVIELRARGYSVEQQREFPAHYRGQFIGKLVPDMIVDGKVIADPKVASGFNDTHTAQMLGYLNITGLDVAILLNFKESKLTWKRVANERRTNAITQDFPDLGAG